MHADQRLKADIVREIIKKSGNTVLCKEMAQRNWGLWLYFAYLRNIKGLTWNHRWVYQIYQQLELYL